MKKVLLSAALLLASSAVTVIASMGPEAPKAGGEVVKIDATTHTAPAMTGEHHHKGSHHGMAHMSKEEVVAHLAKKGAEVHTLGEKLTGMEKELFDSAMARFDTWVKVIGGFADKDTNPSISAKRAKHELRLAKAIAHHKDGFPAEKVAKWESDFAALKAEVANLKGDTKTVGDTEVAHVESVLADAKKAKDSTLAALYLNAVRYEIDALKGTLHHAAHKAADASKMAMMAAPAATMAAPHTDADAKPADKDAKPAEAHKAA